MNTGEIEQALQMLKKWTDLAMRECPPNSNRYESAKFDRGWAERMLQRLREKR